jgi:hypothetical protein
MRLFLFSVFFLTQLACFGQIFDDFSDGDFTSGTPWQGTNADYIVNGSEQLQLNNAGAATSYLSTPHNLSPFISGNKEWQFWTRQAFSPSSGNFARIYLTSSNSDLSTAPDGFYLQLGEAGTSDAVRLFKSDGGIDTELISGPSGQISTSFSIGIRVVRTIGGDWSLYIDPAGGTNFGLVGSATDATDLLGTHSGMLNIYTSSNSTSFYYDDIYIGNEILDITPPVLLSATVINDLLIDVLFDEALNQASAEDPLNYSYSPSLGIFSYNLDGSNPALVHLVPNTPLSNGDVYDVTTTNIADIEGNISGAQTTDFAYLISEIPVAGDVVINEVMFKETPPVGQPLVEYVEIYNRSTKIFNVQGWKLGDASSNGTLLSDWLLPDGYMILTKTSGVDSFAVATGVTSFPSLNNTGDDLILRSDNGLTLDSISYLDDWWNNSSISGGVSIERINPNDPCSDNNDWTASADVSGGTPGTQNSVFDPTPDTTDPELSFLLALSPNFLEIYYNEGMDSTSLSNTTLVFTPPLTVLNNYVLSSPADMQTLEVTPDFIGSQTYTIEIQGVSDCWGNTTTLFGEFALPEVAVFGDLVINELLVDPVSGGKDWIEIYNNSDKLIDLFNYQIADYDDDTIANFKLIEQHILIGADEYIVLGEDISQIAQHYSTVVPDNLYETDLPSYSNDSGSVYLIFNNAVMDRVAYNDDWHFQLLDNTDGVSLERIEPNGESSNGNNWHSAAEAIGFGTPGVVNSQFYPALSNGEFNYTNEVVSPDSDGYQDVLQINYQMVEPGYVGHFTVYDDRGRLISRVVESELLGASGTFSWGGVKDDGTKTSIGTYVGVFEAFQIDGGVVFTKKKAFVVAGKI